MKYGWIVLPIAAALLEFLPKGWIFWIAFTGYYYISALNHIHSGHNTLLKANPLALEQPIQPPDKTSHP